jgi:hypothetical protein
MKRELMKILSELMRRNFQTEAKKAKTFKN